MQTLKMTPAQWHLVAPNPIQRNTEERAKKAVRGHLKHSSPTQKHVHAARLPGGTLIKLDGHTRGLLWATGRLDQPDFVEVILYDVESPEEAIALYKHFDNPAAAENAVDRLSGAFRNNGITPISTLLSKGGITSAFLLIDYSASIYEMVKKWKKELELLDQLDLHQKQMPSTLVCAALLTLRKHGQAAVNFWETYARNGGVKSNGAECGVEQLTKIVNSLRDRKRLAASGTAQREHQAGRAISCCEAWIKGQTFTVGAKATDLKAYIQTLPVRSKK